MTYSKVFLVFSLVVASFSGCVWAAPLVEEPPKLVSVPELPEAFYTEYAHFLSTTGDEPPTPEPSTTTGGCEPKPTETDCYKCPDCYDGQWQCYIIDCFLTLCVDPVHNTGECCSRCPNGPNCKINNQTVGVGQSVTLADGQVCYCLSENSWEVPEVQCVPQPPTTTEPPCENDTPSVPETPTKEYPIEPTPPETTTTVTSTTTTTRKAPITTAKKITGLPAKKKPVLPIKKKPVLPIKKKPVLPAKKKPVLPAKKTPVTTNKKPVATTTPKKPVATTTPKKPVATI